jgi:hypothetical protein
VEKIYNKLASCLCVGTADLERLDPFGTGTFTAKSFRIRYNTVICMQVVLPTMFGDKEGSVRVIG